MPRGEARCMPGCREGACAWEWGDTCHRPRRSQKGPCTHTVCAGGSCRTRDLPHRQLASPDVLSPGPLVQGAAGSSCPPCLDSGARGAGVLQTRLGFVENSSWLLPGAAEQLLEAQDGARALGWLEHRGAGSGPCCAEACTACHPSPQPLTAPETSPGCGRRDAAASQSLAGAARPVIPSRMRRFPHPRLVPMVPGHICLL